MCVCVRVRAGVRACVCVYEITFVIIFIRNYNLNTICFWLHFILRCPCYSVIILSYNDIILLRVTSRCVVEERAVLPAGPETVEKVPQLHTEEVRFDLHHLCE